MGSAWARGRMATERIAVAGFHMPFPSVGFVAPTGSSCLWRSWLAVLTPRDAGLPTYGCGQQYLRSARFRTLLAGGKEAPQRYGIPKNGGLYHFALSR